MPAPELNKKLDRAVLSPEEVELRDKKFGIVGSMDTKSQSAFPGVSDIGSNTRYGYIGDDERIFQYPLDLGTDSTHYMVFHIYTTDGQTIETESADVAAKDYAAETERYNIIEAKLGWLHNPSQTNYANHEELTARIDELKTEQATSLKHLEELQRQFDSTNVAYSNQQRYRNARGKLVDNKSNVRMNETNIVSKDSIILYSSSLRYILNSF